MSEVGGLHSLVLDQIGARVADLDAALTAVTRAAGAAMVSVRERTTGQPVYVGRRLGVVSAVSASPTWTADVTLAGEVIPGAVPQSTYRPFVGDFVWLEFAGPDAHICAPLVTDANRKWNTVSLAAGWTLNGHAVAWWRDPTGMVFMRGTVQGGAVASVIATLPAGVGARPGSYSAWAVACFGASSFGVVDVTTGGVITYLAGPAAPTAVFLDTIHFRID